MRALCVLAAFGTMAAHCQTVTTLIDHGDPANRIDIVVVSEGYMASEMDKFAADATSFMNGFFAAEAYKEYAGYFNVRAMAVPSNQSGASHPELNPPVVKDTAFGAAYNCAGVARLVCLSSAGVVRLNMLLSSLPANQRDYVLVLVNDSTYGGAGGSYFVSSTNFQAVEIVSHESGHTIGLLTDEYGGPPPPACNLAVEPPAANATKETDRTLIKWNAWIDPGTPLPTTTTTAALPGLYAGAAYCDTGMYRPTNNSKMRALNNPFEQINNEQLVRRIYNIVSPVDSASPAASTVTALQGSPVQFSVTPLAPATHALAVSWTIDGAAQPSGPSLTVDTAKLAAGSHTIQATVHDPTILVRTDSAGLLTDTQTWQLDITSGAPPKLTALAVSPSGIVAGGTATITFNLSGPVPAAGPLTLAVSSSTPAFSVPSSIALQTGQTSGTFTGQAAATIAAPVSGNLTATYNGGSATAGFTLVPPAATPAILGVAGAGQSVPAVLALSTNGLFSIYGSGLAPAGVTGSLSAANLVNHALPTNLAQTCVQIGSSMAPLTYVAASQINALATTLPASGTVTVRVVANCGTASAVTSGAATVTVASATPEFLSFAPSANGSPVAAIQNATGAYVGPVGLLPGAVFAPAAAGDVLTIFGVGFGPTSSTDPPGTIAGGAAGTVGSATVTIGGVAAQVLYSGLTPTFAGLYQMNLVVPVGIPPGNQPIVIWVNGASSPAGAYLAVGR